MIEIQRRPEVDTSVLPAHLPDLLKRIYVSRGIDSAEQLETAAKGLHSYQKLDGIDAAVELLLMRLSFKSALSLSVILMLMARRVPLCRC